jgi:tetratricopeptide (TPR) repeat protein
MRTTLILIQLTFIFNLAYAQPVIGATEEARDLYASARHYLQKTDYANSIMVYNQVIQLEPANLIYRRELAHVYYLQGDLLRAEKMITPLLKSNDADEETFQIASKVLSKKKKMDDAKAAINKGIDKFPNSGLLYKEKGDLFTAQKKYADAAKAWEKGVEKDPTYHLNYYNLSKVYFFTKDYWWAIYYGEIFVNMESFSAKSQEIKKTIYESYKFFMAELNNVALQGKPNRYDNPQNFEACVVKTFDNLRNVVTGGINIDNLIMLRIRFLLDWNKTYASQFPSTLFDMQQNLLRLNYFDAYNQWLFGRLDNEKQFTSWTQTHNNLMNQFDSHIRKEKLRPKYNQYYHTH